MSYARAFITRRGLAAVVFVLLISVMISACAEQGASPAGPTAGIDSPDTAVVQRTAAAAGKFDGEWKGKFIADDDDDRRVCKFDEKYFDAAIKDSRFVAVIDQEGEKRIFEGTIGKEGKFDIWGHWELSNSISMQLSDTYLLNLSGEFSQFKFKGTLTGATRGTSSREDCRAAVYMARAPRTLAEVEAEAEATAADPELYKKVKALEKLVEQAAGGARPAPLAVEEGKPATKGGIEIAKIAVNPDAPFDGEWKGKFIARTPKVCMFREKYFEATVKDNEFVAVIDQEGVKRKFQGIIGKEGILDIWGKWKLSDLHVFSTWGSVGIAVIPINISGNFSGSRFEGRSWARIGQATKMAILCKGVIYLARAPQTLAEVEAEATAADPVLYRKVKALEKLLGQAAKAGGAPPPGGQAPDPGPQAAAQGKELDFWDSIKGSTRVEDFQGYIETYPEGRFAALTRRIIEQLADLGREREELQAWESVKDSTKTQEFQGYLKTYPDGRFAVLARIRVQQLADLAQEREELQAWESVKDGTRSGDFQGYLKTYPEGRFAVLARTRVRQLAALAREGEELKDWEAVKDSTRIEDLKAYLGTYPTGRFAGAAEQRRKELLRLAAIPDIDFGQYYALVIGNNEHEFLPDLKTAKADARAVAEVLQDRYGFTVELLLNATRRDILQALGTLRRKLTEDDNLLVYYAGHGVIDEATERGYWLPVDAEEDINVNWISTTAITDALKATDAWHAMVVADSCYSGTLVRGISAPAKGGDRTKLLERLALKKSRTVLTSGGLEPVMDSGGGGHSVFAKAFLDVLRENDEVLEAQRVFTALRSKVVANADQTPQYSDVRKAGHGGGDFLLVPSR